MGGVVFLLPFLLALTNAGNLVEVLEDEHSMTFLEYLPTHVLNKIEAVKGPQYTIVIPDEEELRRWVNDNIEPAFAHQLLSFHVLHTATTTANMSGVVESLLELPRPETVRFHTYRILVDQTPQTVHTAHCRVVQKADLLADNGVLHIIDQPMLPFMGTVWDYVSSRKTMQGFTDIIRAAGLADSLSGTVFIPTDEAIADNPAYTIEDILESQSYAEWLVNYHSIRGDLCCAGMYHLKTLDTLNEGQSWVISQDSHGDLVLDDSARFVEQDIVCSNGVVHVIDAVLWPSAWR